MKQLFTLSAFLLLAIHVMAQSDADNNGENDQIELDVLRAPSSPAANLLDITNGQILTPTDPTGFMTILNQSTSGFSALPDEFAVDIAPWILFDGKNRTLEESYSEETKDNFKNTFVFSLATKSLDSLEFDNLSSVRRFSTGIKFSLKRGKEIDQSYLEKLNKLRSLREKAFGNVNEQVKEAKTNDAYYQELDSLRKLYLNNISSLSDGPAKELMIKTYQNIQHQLALREEELSEKIQNEANEELSEAKEIVENLKLKRYGWKADVAAGTVWDFPNDSFDKGTLTKAGVWVTGGYDGSDGIALLFIARYMLNPDFSYLDNSDLLQQDDVNNLDVGGKIQYTSNNEKFTGAFEYLIRDYSKDEVEDGNRFTVNLSYDIGANRQIGFMLGKNFDGTITKDGNVIAAINLLLGFDNKVNIN